MDETIKIPNPYTRCFHCCMPGTRYKVHPSGSFFACEIPACQSVLQYSRDLCYHAPTQEVRTSVMLFLFLQKVDDYEPGIVKLIYELTMDPAIVHCLAFHVHHVTFLRHMEIAKTLIRNTLPPGMMRNQFLLIAWYLSEDRQAMIRSKFRTRTWFWKHWNIAHVEVLGDNRIDNLMHMFKEFYQACHLWKTSPETENRVQHRAQQYYMVLDLMKPSIARMMLQPRVLAPAA